MKVTWQEPPTKWWQFIQRWMDRDHLRYWRKWLPGPFAANPDGSVTLEGIIADMFPGKLHFEAKWFREVNEDDP